MVEKWLRSQPPTGLHWGDQNVANAPVLGPCLALSPNRYRGALTILSYFRYRTLGSSGGMARTCFPIPGKLRLTDIKKMRIRNGIPCVRLG
jgi:hypothetical protein